MPIPRLVEDTEILPPGEHLASLREIEEQFGTSSFRRRELMKELRWIVEELLSRGVVKIWVDGSFTTGEPRPRDVDVVYEPAPGDDPRSWGILAPGRRRDLKHRHKIDLWKHPTMVSDLGLPTPIEKLFQTDRNGQSKGIIVLEQEQS